jgi:tetratricopeptide (TPR) repeat protein
MLRFSFLLLGLSLVTGACSQRTKSTVRWNLDCSRTDERLARTWAQLTEIRAEGCLLPSGVDQCEFLRAEIDRLAQVCPQSANVLLANAALAYGERQFFKAQQLLDQLLGAPGPNPQAAALRARIAMEEGNLPYALRLSEQHIRLSPEDPGLREVRASVLFLSRRYDEARRELDTAERLGAPGWRVAYHRGLLAESQGLNEAAAAQFRKAIEMRPGWNAPAARLKGLEAVGR